jgi:Flp pilus assembly protein CpaB
MVVGVILAALAAGAVWMLTRASQREAVALVATRDVPPLTQVLPTDVALRRLPIQAVPRDALRAVSQASGEFVRYGLLAGQVVRAANLAKTAEGASQFDAQLTSVSKGAKGGVMRAVTLAVTPQTGLVLPQAGDLVDIVAVIHGVSGNQARTLAQGVRVLDRLVIGGSSSRGQPGRGRVSTNTVQAQQGILVLALTVDQAEQVALAQSMGTVQVVLDPWDYRPGVAPQAITAEVWGMAPTGTAAAKGGK